MSYPSNSLEFERLDGSWMVGMYQECKRELADQWKIVCEQYSQADLEATFQFVQTHADAFVLEFYQQMLLEEQALEFLSVEMVQNRLKNSLHQWLVSSFEVPFKQNYLEIVEKQFKVGDVHARVHIPSWMILRGVRIIIKKALTFLANEPYTNLNQINYLCQILCFATEIMCRSYELKVEVHNDMKHTYRLFSAMQDVTVQKDRQRGTLLDWENELMFQVVSDHSKLTQPILSKTEFGLWFIHKAAYAFSNTEQVGTITDRIYQVDELIEQIKNSESQSHAVEMIQLIRAKNREILHLIDQIFQVSEYINSGNDALTQLLNRRYLSTIVAREINFARKNNTPLTVLSIDADHFKYINDHYGHAAGDEALQFLADSILQYTKGSDYAFRIGGEEFLLLQVDTNVERALKVAENIRKRVADRTVNTSTGASFNFTVSIGVHEYDGHPDYQRFLDAVDKALYVAKNNGRNNVYMG